MKVGMIAPGMEKDGLKKYTDFLADELREEVDIERIELFETVSLIESLKLALATSDYDLVHIQFTPEFWGNIFGYFWGSYLIPFLLVSRSRTVVTAHEYEFDHPNPVVYRIQALKNRLIYSLADRVIVHNERGREYIQELAPRASVEVIPHGIPEVDEVEEELDIEGTVLLVFGFIRRDKDYETVLEALEQLPDDYRLLIAGSARTEEDEEYEEELKQEVEERGLQNRVTFYGYVPEEEIGKVFNTADFSILPYDNCSGSGVLALSLAYEVPVVMSDMELAEEYPFPTYSSTRELIEKLMKDELDSGMETEGKVWGEVAEITSKLYRSVVD